GQEEIRAKVPAIPLDSPFIPADPTEVAHHCVAIPRIEVGLEPGSVVPELPLTRLQEEIVHGQGGQVLRGRGHRRHYHEESCREQSCPSARLFEHHDTLVVRTRSSMPRIAKRLRPG